jgi:hypothetical protein
VYVNVIYNPLIVVFPSLLGIVIVDDETDIPNLSSFSSDEESEGSATRALATPSSVRDATNMIIQLCQLLFSMVIMESAFGKGKRTKSRF